MAEFFDRLDRVIRAEMADASLSQDPQKVIEEALNEMHQGLNQLRFAILSINNKQDQLELNLKQAQAEVLRWKRRADLALAKGNENLAREALERRQSWLRTAATLTAQLQQMSDDVESLKRQKSALEGKLIEANAKKNSLVERAGKAVSSNTMAALDRMEKQILRQETLRKTMAELEGRSLEEQFASLEPDSDVDKELEAIKEQLFSEIEANSDTESDNNISFFFEEDDELKKLKNKLDQL